MLRTSDHMGPKLVYPNNDSGDADSAVIDTDHSTMEAVKAPAFRVSRSAGPESSPSESPVQLSPPVDLFASAKVSISVPQGVMPPTAPIDTPVMCTSEKIAALSVLNDLKVSCCTKCRLHETRTQTVFGEGDVDARIFFVGEGPGETEDETGRPFVGRAGQLLDKMIGAMGLSRAQVFIANIVKCRPPGNRVPAPDEVETCTPYLVQQLETVRPRVIVTLGLPAVKYMLGDPKLTMGKTRGQWHTWRGIKLMPTYHPSYVLRAYTDANRAAVWSDLQQVMKEIGLVSARAQNR